MTFLQEARIIFPRNDDTAALIAPLLGKIAAFFGGLTAIEGRGMFHGAGQFYDEPVLIVDVAVDVGSAEHADMLYKLAEQFAENANEECVYLRLPNGAVQFVPQRPEILANRAQVNRPPASNGDRS